MRNAIIAVAMAVATLAQAGGHWRFERQREAIEFDGTNDRVDVPGISNADLTGSDGFTITAWVYDDGTANGRIADKSDATSSAGGFYIAVIPGQIPFNINAVNRVDSPEGSLPTNQWTFVAVSVQANGEFVLYVGDTVTSGTTGATSGITTSNGFAIGDRAAGDRKFNGTIDDTRIYSRALSAAEVLDLYRGADISDTGLEAWYKFDGDALDSSGNENHGTEVGDPEYVAETPDASGNGNHGTLVGSPTLVAGRVGRGLGFVTASSQSVTAGTSLISAPFTFAAWVNVGTGQHQVLVAQGADLVPSFVFYANTDLGSATAQVRVYIGGEVLIGPALVGAGWKHVAMSMTAGGAVALYVDGRLYASGSTANSVPSGTTYLARRDYAPSPYYFNGTIDEPIITPYAWTAAEVRRYYYRGKVPARPAE